MPEDVEGYAYASCQVCPWKKSVTITSENDRTILDVTAAEGKAHAIDNGHKVSVTLKTIDYYDYRVEPRDT